MLSTYKIFANRLNYNLKKNSLQIKMSKIIIQNLKH